MFAIISYVLSTLLDYCQLGSTDLDIVNQLSICGDPPEYANHSSPYVPGQSIILEGQGEISLRLELFNDYFL